MKIKKGDIVKIISGNDKSKQGKVLAVFPSLGKIVVEGVNVKKKHTKPKEAGRKGELVRFPAPIWAARTMLVCPKCGQSARSGLKSGNSKIKLRVCKKCGAEF